MNNFRLDVISGDEHSHETQENFRGSKVMKNLLLHSPVETSDHLITHHDTAVAQQPQVHLQTEGGTAEIKPLNQREDQGKDGGVQEKETPPGVQEEQTPQGLRWWRKETQVIYWLKRSRCTRLLSSVLEWLTAA